MTTSPSPLQLDFLESVSLVFAGYAWERADLAQLTAVAGSGLVSPAQDLLLALQTLSDLDFGAVAIPRRSVFCVCESK
ncbi:hypothetical protein ACETRX_30700 [Labrys portucalensis]|uniref:Uncharacterized protein n=1 Tax=Labrys neptuniae TaxID=376174 RepID=A0ABV6ZPE4_9HYPH|nr:hypothetical protein [Labrys neptuniae]MDT3377394.1 hypothetical protein [Labrys neptuniae]